MRIGFDGKRALQNSTGLGNYSRFVISSLTKYQPQNDYFLYASADKKRGEFPGVKFRQPISNSRFWRSFGIVKDLVRDKVDVYHGLSNELPFGIKRSGIKSIVTVHDLIFLRFPQYYPTIDRWIYKFKTRAACKNATKIIAISQQTKADLVEFLKIPDDKIEVVYQDCAQQFKPESGFPNEDIIKRKYDLPANYILNVGTIEERKNAGLIVKALPKIPTEINLVIVGKKGPYFDILQTLIKELNLEHRVHFRDNVEFSDLPSIYRMARVFVYPSRFEGFGIPIIEALNCEVPVIAATGSCLEEAGGSSSLYVDPDNDVELAENINMLLNDAEQSASLVRKGLEYVQKFDSRHIAEQLVNIYNNA